MALDLPKMPAFEPTSDVPIVTETMALFLQQFEEPMCMADMAEFIRDIARTKKDQAEDKMNQEATNMRKILKEHDLANELLHTIPRHLLKAAILGITAPLTRGPKTMPGYLENDIYAFDGPGTYIIAVAIAGRSGKFLTGEELDKLIGALKKYLQAEEKWRLDPQAFSHRDELSHFVAQIDSQFTNANLPGTAYIAKHSPQRRKVEALVDTLEQMRKHVKNKEPVCQAPQYVGCTTSTAAEHAQAHLPEAKWNTGKGNQVYWLVLSCLRHMGLEPDIVVTPFIRTYEKGQLECSEILGTLLAGSLVEERGYNVKAPGTTPDKTGPHDWQLEKMAMTLCRTYFEVNIDHSLAVNQRREAMLKFLEEVDGMKVLQELTARRAEYDRVKAEEERVITALAMQVREATQVVMAHKADLTKKAAHARAIAELTESFSRDMDNWLDSRSADKDAEEADTNAGK